jgi:hypothetical protein
MQIDLCEAGCAGPDQAPERLALCSSIDAGGTELQLQVVMMACLASVGQARRQRWALCSQALCWGEREVGGSGSCGCLQAQRFSRRWC